MIKLITSPSFKRTVTRFRAGRMVNGATIGGVAHSGAEAMANAAKAHLKRMVYSAELPASAQPGGSWAPDKYMQERRLGGVWRAIKVTAAKPEGAGRFVATATVDRGDFQGYYYALILNFGGMGGRYQARPFWTNASKSQAARFHALGRISMHNLKGYYSGSSAYRSLSTFAPQPDGNGSMSSDVSVGSFE